jgi:hypothetical protein
VETKLVTFAGIDISGGKEDGAIFQGMILRPMALRSALTPPFIGMPQVE